VSNAAERSKRTNAAKSPRSTASSTGGGIGGEVCRIRLHLVDIVIVIVIIIIIIISQSDICL